MQIYESTRWGRGWVGLQAMYEHDRKLADDLNSLTAGLTYLIRVKDKYPFWGCWAEKDAFVRGKNCNPQHYVNPPLVGIRPLEVMVRGGPEWSPSAENTATGTQGIYMPKDLNLVMGATARLPIIISPWIPWHYTSVRKDDGKWQKTRQAPQPSQFTVVPVFGLEGGLRVDSHPIGAPVGLVVVSLAPECSSPPSPPSSTGPTGLCPSHSQLVPGRLYTCTQPQEIFRQVAGVDASLRWPYNITKSFLGDRPITLDFSYRMRWLSYAEPFYDDTYAATNSKTSKTDTLPEGQSSGERSYARITILFPISAYLQLRTSWQRGSLPPLFQNVGNLFKLGLAFSNPGSSEH